MSKRFCWIWHKLKNTNGRRQFVPAATIKGRLKCKRKVQVFEKILGKGEGGRKRVTNVHSLPPSCYYVRYIKTIAIAASRIFQVKELENEE